MRRAPTSATAAAPGQAIRRSLGTRLTASVVLVLVGLIFIFGATFQASMRRYHEQIWHDQALAIARNLALGAELGVAAEVESYLAGPARGALEVGDVRYVIVTDAAGRVLHAQGDTAAAVAIALPAAHGEGAAPAVLVRTPGRGGDVHEAVAAVTAPEPAADVEGRLWEEAEAPARLIGWVRLGLSHASMDREIAVLTGRLALIGAFVLIAGLLASLALGRHVTRPLRKLADAAAAIGQGRWDHRVDVAGDDEIGYLASRFRQMAQDLHAAEEEILEQNRTLEVKVAERTASLSRALDELRELDRLKDAFLSSVSHELRTPLTAIRSFSDALLLYEDEAPETRREFLTIISRESERLTRLIEDVLDFSKLQSGRRRWVKETFPIEAVIAAAGETVAPLLEEKRLLLSLPDPGGLTLVRASRDGVTQVLQNLLSNAIKFSPEGATIEVIVSSADGRVEVQVADRGPGIPEAEEERVFDRFHQVGDTLTAKPKGTGLGLAICREIIRQHGGTIRAERREGGGSRFRFVLPAGEERPAAEASPEASDGSRAPGEGIAGTAAAPAAGGEAPAGAIALAGDRCTEAAEGPKSGGPAMLLVVDDEPSVRRLMEHELTRRGYRVALAENGVAAIQMTRTLRPALVILDIMMPDLTGFDVIRVLKNDPETASIPIVVVSVVEDRERGLRLGAGAYLTKPFAPEALVARVESLLAQRRPSILLVSRDAAGVGVLRSALSERGYRVESTGDPETADRLLHRRSADLVVVDGADPSLDASAFLRRLQAAPALESIPVLVLTAQSVEEQGVWALRPGTERSLPRGTDPAAIAAALEELLVHAYPQREAA